LQIALRVPTKSDGLGEGWGTTAKLRRLWAKRDERIQELGCDSDAEEAEMPKTARTGARQR